MGSEMCIRDSRNSMRFSPMWISISEKVVSNLRLADGSLRALRLPPPPKTDIAYQLYPLFSHSIAPFLYRQTLSMHVKPNESGVKPNTLTARCGNSRITGKTGSHMIRNNLELKQQINGHENDQSPFSKMKSRK